MTREEFEIKAKSLKNGFKSGNPAKRAQAHREYEALVDKYYEYSPKDGDILIRPDICNCIMSAVTSKSKMFLEGCNDMSIKYGKFRVFFHTFANVKDAVATVVFFEKKYLMSGVLHLGNGYFIPCDDNEIIDHFKNNAYSWKEWKQSDYFAEIRLEMSSRFGCHVEIKDAGDGENNIIIMSKQI